MSLKKLEHRIESFLWNSRLVVIVAVITSMLTAIAMFFIASVDAVIMLGHLPDYIAPNTSTEARALMRTGFITHIVEIVDGYLLAIIMLIFALGLYELFISKIDQAEKSENASKVLLIHSLDDLKERLSKVIIMILIVKFFEHAISLTFTSPIELLILAGGITLIGLTLYLTHANIKH